MPARKSVVHWGWWRCNTYCVEVSSTRDPMMGYTFVAWRKKEAERIMEEVHQGICGPHINRKMLAKKILRMGYYWNTMETDCINILKCCHDCQTHANLNHVPPSDLYSMTSPWPFSVWGIDVIGRIAPKPRTDTSTFWLQSTTSLSGCKWLPILCWKPSIWTYS